MVRRHLSLKQFRSAQATMRRRSRQARRVDRRRAGRLTTSLKLWRSNPARYDIRGIDRKRKRYGRRRVRR